MAIKPESLKISIKQWTKVGGLGSVMVSKIKSADDLYFIETTDSSPPQGEASNIFPLCEILDTFLYLEAGGFYYVYNVGTEEAVIKIKEVSN